MNLIVSQKFHSDTDWREPRPMQPTSEIQALFTRPTVTEVTVTYNNGTSAKITRAPRGR